ncbi:MAG: hypothetical protein D6714_10155 [Bacteroidetes bacterium]|nr:MAG: hypothetical protein D6714_10155 [Bacteroidota bacterium]
MNCTKLLSLEEVAVLARTFDLNLNKYFLDNTNRVEVSFPFLESKVASGRIFVEELAGRLAMISRWPGVELLYITSEMPIFNYFRYTELALFKLYVFGRTVWGIPEMRELPFSLTRNRDPKTESLFEQINNAYISLPGTEIWNTKFLDNTLGQIKYFAQGRLFENNEDAAIILEQLSLVLKEIESAAQAGHKMYKNGEKGGKFGLYHNEIIHTNNLIMIRSDKEKLLVSTYDNPDFFESKDERLWDYSFHWLTNLKERAQLISEQSERNRRKFFKANMRKINQVKAFVL